MAKPYTPITRWDIQRLAKLRLNEARALAKKGHSEGAYYLGRYGLECALKACIAKRTKRFEFHNMDLAIQGYTHDLEQLLDLAELKGALTTAIGADRHLGVNWAIVKEWKSESRYRIRGLNGQDMVKALSHPPGSGVLQWIRKHW